MKKLYLLFFFLSLIFCDNELQTLEEKISQDVNQNYLSSCELIIPRSKMDCVIATLESNFNCCYVYINKGKKHENKSCVYLSDNYKIIKSYANSLKIQDSNFQVICQECFIKYHIYLLLIIFILF